jgi:hypothetical protein
LKGVWDEETFEEDFDWFGYFSGDLFGGSWILDS